METSVFPASDYVLAATLGLVLGSFMLAAALRYPELKGFATGRSACPACHSSLAACDLVPVLSWLWLRARCRRCAARIGWHYPAAELAGAGIAVWAATVFSGWLLWLSCGLGWCLLALSLFDMRSYRVPDALTLPLLLAGLVVTFIAWPDELSDHLLGAALGYAVVAGIAALYRHLRRRQGIGLGDAKLLAAGGAWLSWQPLPTVVLVAAALAMLAAVAAAASRRVPLSPALRVPFAPFLGLAIWLIWLYGVPEIG
ncbi:MAG: prepilin peptidase [Thiohalocapsa sp.]